MVFKIFVQWPGPTLFVSKDPKSFLLDSIPGEFHKKIIKSPKNLKKSQDYFTPLAASVSVMNLYSASEISTSAYRFTSSIFISSSISTVFL